MKTQPHYILLISIHGLIRGQIPELGRDADTGGQVKYVLELAGALGEHKNVERVDLITRYILDPELSTDYSQETELLGNNVNIVRIKCGGDRYISKEELWEHLDNFVDNVLLYIKNQDRLPDIIHSHYADAGYVGTRLSNLLNIPLLHTGHSLGRIKRKRLQASGMRPEVIEQRYNIIRRIKAEEETLANASLIITSTHQEIKDQYGLYDYNQPRKMQVIPPGTDLNTFHPADETEWNTNIFAEISQFLNNPYKPIILALSRLDQRKNIISLVEAYGQCPELKELANLVIFVGVREDLQDLPTEAQELLFKLFTTIDLYNLYGKIAYPKKLAFTELPTMYRLAALSGGVFVNPALTEPFGLTLIEAAASGLPIVATEDGGPIDIIGNCRNGYLINPLDTMDIADRIFRVLGNRKNYSQLAKNGLVGVREHYSWTSHVEQYLTCINLILQQHSTHERIAFAGDAIRYNQGAIVTGLDQILVGDVKALREFIDLLHQHRQDIIFCVATGRRLDSALNLLKQNKIPQPDVLITSMGTEIYYSPDLTKDVAWSNHIDRLWNRRALQRILSDFSGLVLQPKLEQSEFKISYFYDSEKAPSIEEIQRNLRQNEQTVNTFLGFGQYLDIVPARASKGYALRWFIEQWNIPLENILTVGATGMDEDLMRGNTLSVVVGGKHDSELAELVETGPIFFSEKTFAAGILDGIKYYNFFERCAGKGVKSSSPI